MPVNQFRSVDEALSELEQRGFQANFEYLERKFTAVDSGRTFEAEELTIVEEHRVEGDSDPDDESIVYAIESHDGTRGVLVDAYGTYANAELGEFLRRARTLPPAS
jgi:hypothetical protein